MIKNSLVYDLEIVRAIPSKDSYVEGIEYCNGWDDHVNMGISVVCAYDFLTDRYRVFDKHSKDEFERLTQTRYPLVGFNNVNFDNSVLAACWNIPIVEAQCFDLLRAIWKAKGLGTTFNYETHVGYGLDACARANFGLSKTGYGGDAPIDWQRGKYAKVIDYCLQDVRLTKMLWEKIFYDRIIIDPKELKPLFVDVPLMDVK